MRSLDNYPISLFWDSNIHCVGVSIVKLTHLNNHLSSQSEKDKSVTTNNTFHLILTHQTTTNWVWHLQTALNPIKIHSQFKIVRSGIFNCLQLNTEQFSQNFVWGAAPINRCLMWLYIRFTNKYSQCRLIMILKLNTGILFKCFILAFKP